MIPVVNFLDFVAGLQASRRDSRFTVFFPAFFGADCAIFRESVPIRREPEGRVIVRSRPLLRRACWLMLSVAVLPAGCDDDDPSTSDPDFCYGIVFTEYLQVDSEGAVTAAGGEDQWCYPGNGADPFLPQLYPAYPNPAYGAINISWVLPEAMHLRLRIVDADCRVVKTLVDQQWISGFADLTWDCRDDDGDLVPEGRYACLLTAGGFTCHGTLNLDAGGQDN